MLLGWKGVEEREVGKVLIKTDVLGGLHGDIGGRVHSNLYPLFPSVCPHAAPKTKKLAPPMLLSLLSLLYCDRVTKNSIYLLLYCRLTTVTNDHQNG